MAKGINKVMLLGNVGKQPEFRATNGGTSVASFSLATPDRRKDNRGEWVEATEWHHCVAFGRTAEIVRDYAPKGAKLYIEGKLQTRSWDDRESGQKRYKTEIIVFDVILLGRKPGSGEAERGDVDTSFPGNSYAQDGGIDDSDIPF